jgi:hypothetical protein
VALSDPDAQALIWRVHGLVNGLDAVAGGPTKGEKIPSAGTLRQVSADLSTLRATVADLQARPAGAGDCHGGPDAGAR